jgi:hypothetical protein
MKVHPSVFTNLWTILNIWDDGMASRYFFTVLFIGGVAVDGLLIILPFIISILVSCSMNFGFLIVISNGEVVCSNGAVVKRSPVRILPVGKISKRHSKP